MQLLFIDAGTSPATGEMITGPVLSVTVTVNEHGAEIFPDASLAVYVTVVAPTGKEEPGECDRVQVMLPEGVQLSDAVGSVQLTMAEQIPGELFTAIFAGQAEITGGIASATVTVATQLSFPKLLFTVRVTLLAPRSEQLKAVRLRVFVMPQPELLPLSIMGMVRTAVPEASRFRVVFLHSASMNDSVGPAEKNVEGEDWLLNSVFIQFASLTARCTLSSSILPSKK